MDRNFFRVSQSFGESIAALKVEVKPSCKQMPSHPAPILLRNHKTGRNVAGVGRTEGLMNEMTPSEPNPPSMPYKPPQPVPFNMELSIIATIIWDRIICHHPPPFHQDSSEGERSELNDPEFYDNYIERCFKYTYAEAHHLPPDEPTHGGKWVTHTARFSDRRPDLLYNRNDNYTPRQPPVIVFAHTCENVPHHR